MKVLINALLLLLLMGTEGWARTIDGIKCESHPAFCQIMTNKPQINPKYAMKLSNIIHQAATAHQIPKRIYTAILMQESSYKTEATNCTEGVPVPNCIEMGGIVERKKCEEFIYDSKRVCTDFGIAQIYYKTARNYGLNLKRLINDLEYSVYAGAMVLAYFKKRYADKEPDDWWVRFNVGTREKSSIINSWNSYYEDVSRYR